MHFPGMVLCLIPRDVLPELIYLSSRRMAGLRQADTKAVAFIYLATIPVGCRFHYQVSYPCESRLSIFLADLFQVSLSLFEPLHFPRGGSFLQQPGTRR